MARTLGWSLSLVAVSALGVLALASRPQVEPPIPARVANSVTSFASGHPEWAVLRDSRKDATPLLMGHAKHMDPQLPGGPLTCISCHVMDDSGRYMQPITFAQHCAQCHEDNLGRINVAEGLVDSIAAPHGSTEGVLDAIEAQLHAMVGAHPEKFVITEDAAVDAPADAGESADGAQSSGRRKRGRSPSSKTTEVPTFASAEARQEWIKGRGDAVVSNLQAKCAYCHFSPESQAASSPWVIASPAIPDRWLARSHYSHAAHSMLSCDQCHDARTSAATSDILLPGIDSCRQCHQPASAGSGGAPTECVLCHTYHAPAPVHEGALRSASLGRGGAAQGREATSAPKR
jgi:hypothetical protein